MNTLVSDSNSELSEDAVPIREISRITSVNTVTLRAWERRYGLLIPQRTNKGHRLYSRADIERVQEIQLWLGRGLAISKVKALLADDLHGKTMPQIDSVWLELIQQMTAAISAFSRKQLERLIEDTFSLYPVPMVADFLLSPLLLDLAGEEPGKPIQRAFFSAVLMEYLFAAQNRQRQTVQGARVLVASAQAEESALPQVLHYGLLVNQVRSECLGYLGGRELLLGTEALKAKVVVIMGSETVNPGELQLHLNIWRERDSVALILAGDMVRTFRALHNAAESKFYLCDTQHEVLDTVNQLLKGKSLI